MTEVVQVDRQPGQSEALPMLLQYWQLLLRWRWIVAGIILGALALGLLVTLLTTPQYTATAEIEISREQKNITKVEGLDSPNAGQDIEFYQTQYNLLEARSLAERVARKLRLAQNKQFFDSHGESIEEGLFGSESVQPSSREERDRREDKAIQLLLDHVEIAPIRGSSLVDVHYTSASPQLSAEIANEWTQQFIALSMDRRFASTADARKFLEGRLADLRTRLEESERNVVNYASNKGIVSIPNLDGSAGNGTIVAADLAALNRQLIEATADRIAAQARMQQGADKTTSEDPLLASSAIADLRSKRAQIAAEYAKLLVQFDPQYPAARALHQQLDALDKSIKKEEANLSGREGSRSASVRAADYRAALERENKLRERVNQMLGRLDRQQRDTIQYNIYQRDADTNRQLYEALLQRYKEIGVAGVEANNIAVIDEAQVPKKPSKPRLALNLLLALFGGMAASGIAILALDQIDESLREPGQVGPRLGLPLLGSVPEIEDENVLDLLRDAKSELIESYLSVRSNLAFTTDHGLPRSLMVTSSRPAEGKSTTSFALANVLARTGKNVLLLDADMRSPSIHEFLGVKNERGLSNYLSGDDDWRGSILVNPAGPDFMAAGPHPPSAAELLSSERMSTLFAELLQTYDNVIVDSPPVLGLADAPLLSRSVEGCAFVAESAGVSVRGIKAAIARLQAVHAHVYGIILTKVQRKATGYGYGYGYGYGRTEGEAD